MKSVKTSLFFVAMAAVLALSGSARATEGPISYWRFDEGEGTAAYDSIGDNDGTIYGPTWTSGIFGGALSFDGVNDYINVGNDASLTNLTPTAMTIEAWVYNTQTIATGTVDLRTVVAQRENNNSKRGYGLNYGYVEGYGINDYLVGIAFWGGYEGHSNYHILPNQWYHIVGVFENNVGAIYINGVVQTTWSGGSSYGNSIADVMIGRHGNFSSRLDYHRGIIDEVAIYNRALTAEEIQQHFLQPGLGPKTVAIGNITRAIAEKVEALERIDTAIAKEWAAYGALEEFLAGGDYGDLNRSDIIRAKQNIFAAIQQQEQSKITLEQSLRKLEDSLWLLGS